VAIFIAATCFVSAELGLQFHLSPLLLSLAAGALVANLDLHDAERIERAVDVAGLPVFAIFFAAAGAGLHLDALRSIGLLALVLVLARGVSIVASTRVVLGGDPSKRSTLWMGLISQAGVTFGLAALVGRNFPGFGAKIETLIVAVITLHELIGPVLTRRALQLAGELPEGATGQRV
jgi:Kef-type K+ transport system membrane component KefB